MANHAHKFGFDDEAVIVFVKFRETCLQLLLKGYLAAPRA
jgi:hypothetical protein